MATLVYPVINSVLNLKMKKFLHVGCGPQNQTSIQKGFNTPDWEEVRLDIDPDVNPDVVGTITDMERVASGSMDAVFSSHNLEHIFPHEVPMALAEFKRVLKPDGFVVVTCPDIQSVCAAVAEDNLLGALYVSPAGPIAPIDMLFGHRASVAGGKVYMAHKCGFTYTALAGCFLEAGFGMVGGGRRLPYFDLWLLAYKVSQPEEYIRSEAAVYLP